jgi:hypothetical protein
MMMLIVKPQVNPHRSYSKLVIHFNHAKSASYSVWYLLQSFPVIVSIHFSIKEKPAIQKCGRDKKTKHENIPLGKDIINVILT